MAVKNERPEKSIRINMLGGFNRRDVMDYIQALVTRYKSENAAYIEAAENLRKERDDLRASLARFQEQADDTQALRTQTEELSDRMESLMQQLAEQKTQADGLLEALAAKENVLAGAMDEADALREKLRECESELSAFHAAKLKAADMELVAYQRAEAIEQEANQEAEESRQAFRRLIDEARQAYESVRQEAGTAVSGIREKLDEMNAWLTDAPARFDSIAQKLDTIPLPEKMQVRPFSPPSFDEPEQPILEDDAQTVASED